ncbi:MAG: hypothetical protein WB679_09610, partial [Terracidiphilus sp.]
GTVVYRHRLDSRSFLKIAFGEQPIHSQPEVDFREVVADACDTIPPANILQLRHDVSRLDQRLCATRLD